MVKASIAHPEPSLWEKMRLKNWGVQLDLNDASLEKMWIDIPERYFSISHWGLIEVVA